jgi:hypothetical protein
MKLHIPVEKEVAEACAWDGNNVTSKACDNDSRVA